jgi:uncharacterized protein YjiS (DUF1127 family)
MTSLDTSAAMISASGHWASRFDLALRRLADWRDARATRAALRRLSAHELDDIGLTRDAVESMAWPR